MQRGGGGRGLNKKQKRKEGVMYAPGAFGGDQPGPSGCGGYDDELSSSSDSSNDDQSSQAGLAGKKHAHPITSDDSDYDQLESSDDHLSPQVTRKGEGKAGGGGIWKGKAPRKCAIFGICCEAIPRQVCYKKKRERECFN